MSMRCYNSKPWLHKQDFFFFLFIMQPLVPIETSKSSETLGQGDWLALERIEFIDKQGTKRNWERCIRRKSHSNKVDGKMMFLIMTITTYIYQQPSTFTLLF